MATTQNRQDEREREREQRRGAHQQAEQSSRSSSQESTMKSGGTRYQTSTSGLNEEARKAVTGAFDAMSEWRDEVTSTTERCTDKVLDRIGEAAKAMGWPRELVDATRTQFQQASRMQAGFIDQMMDAWQQQLKSPGAPMRTLSGGLGAMPGFDAGASSGLNMAMAPLQMWMQAAEMWQKSWQSAMSRWMEAQPDPSRNERDRDRDRRRA
jgi:hypothetical protein